MGTITSHVHSKIKWIHQLEHSYSNSTQYVFYSLTRYRPQFQHFFSTLTHRYLSISVNDKSWLCDVYVFYVILSIRAIPITTSVTTWFSWYKLTVKLCSKPNSDVGIVLWKMKEVNIQYKTKNFWMFDVLQIQFMIWWRAVFQ